MIVLQYLRLNPNLWTKPYCMKVSVIQALLTVRMKEFFPFVRCWGVVYPRVSKQLEDLSVQVMTNPSPLIGLQIGEGLQMEAFTFKPDAS
jgi:hypothetical protein